jgi:fatty acid desaturase
MNQKVKEFSQLHPLKAYSNIAVDWLLIGVGIALFHQFSWYALPISWLLIASRQHALFVLMHEAAHYRFHKNRFWNEVIGNLFVSFPIMVDCRFYRRTHMLHHQYSNIEGDPDLLRKQGPDWKFPKSAHETRKIWTKLLTGYGPFEMLMTVLMLGGLHPKTWKKNSDAWEALLKVLSLTALTIALYRMGFIKEFLLLWIFPLFYFFPLINRLRSIAEHFGVKNESTWNRTRDVIDLPLWEKFLLAPHGVNYHLTHHEFPSIPCYSLKKFQKFLMENHEMYSQKAHLTKSYLSHPEKSLWKELTA